MKHYIAWFKKLYNEYGLLEALMSAYYNARHFTIKGEYKKWPPN